jgi:hypothetical protein
MVDAQADAAPVAAPEGEFDTLSGEEQMVR